MSAFQWMMSKIGHRDDKKFNSMVDTIAREQGVARGRIVRDMYWNALTRGAGFTDYFRGDYWGASKTRKDTFVTTRSYYKLLEYLNDEGYANVMRNKILFCDVLHEYLGRAFINLRVATAEEFAQFIEGKDCVFAKMEEGFGGHGVSRVDLAEAKENGGRRLYDELRAKKQYLVEEAIQQSAALDEINPNSVGSFRVVTLVKDGVAHLMGNALRVNQDASDVIGCTSDLYFSLNEDGTLASRAIDDLGTIYERHPVTGKRFAEVRIPGVREAFDLCLRAAMEVPQVRYVGWDVAFSTDGPVLMEGNAYPSYGLVQYCRMNGKTTGHLKEIADVLGNEMSQIAL